MSAESGITPAHYWGMTKKWGNIVWQEHVPCIYYKPWGSTTRPPSNTTHTERNKKAKQTEGDNSPTTFSQGILSACTEILK